MTKQVFGLDPDSRVDVPAGNRSKGVEGGKGIFDKYFNQIIFETQANHVWGTQTQVTDSTPTATFYTNGSGTPLDKTASTVTIDDDDRILIAHDVTATANLLLDAGGKKITLGMFGSGTLDMDTYDLTLGGSGDSVGGEIRLTQTGSLTINGNRGLSVNNSTDVYSDWSAKNLAISLASVTTVDATADNIILIDEFGGGERIPNLDETFDITTDIHAGTEKASTTYQLWLSSDGVGNVTRKMVPDITGLADGTAAGFLVDSTNTFFTDKVQAGDIVKDKTGGLQTTVSVTPTADGANLAVTDDIFTSGDSYEINIVSPQGLGQFRIRLGNVPNDASSDLVEPVTIDETISPNVPRLNRSDEQYLGQPQEVEIVKQNGDWVKNQCTAWVKFDAAGSILNSYNVANVVLDSAGVYTVTFSVAMDNAHYAVAGVSQNSSESMINVRSASVGSFQIQNYSTTASNFQSTIASLVIFGGRD